LNFSALGDHRLISLNANELEEGLGFVDNQLEWDDRFVDYQLDRMIVFLIISWIRGPSFHYYQLERD